MSKITTIKMIVLFALLASACKKENVTPTPTPSSTPTNASFDFLQSGNDWVYDMNSFFSSGTWETKIESQTSGKFKIKHILDDGSVVDTISQYWFSSGDYLKSYDDGQTEANAAPVFKANAAVGNSWKDARTTGDTVFYEVVSVKDTVITTVATFSPCVKIKVTFSSAFNTQYNYWSSQYGLVKQEGLLSLDLKSKNF